MTVEKDFMCDLKKGETREKAGSHERIILGENISEYPCNV